MVFPRRGFIHLSSSLVASVKTLLTGKTKHECYSDPVLARRRYRLRNRFKRYTTNESCPVRIRHRSWTRCRTLASGASGIAPAKRRIDPRPDPPRNRPPIITALNNPATQRRQSQKISKLQNVDCPMSHYFTPATFKAV